MSPLPIVGVSEVRHFSRGTWGLKRQDVVGGGVFYREWLCFVSLMWLRLVGEWFGHLSFSLISLTFSHISFHSQERNFDWLEGRVQDIYVDNRYGFAGISCVLLPGVWNDVLSCYLYVGRGTSCSWFCEATHSSSTRTARVTRPPQRCTSGLRFPATCLGARPPWLTTTPRRSMCCGWGECALVLCCCAVMVSVLCSYVQNHFLPVIGTCSFSTLQGVP